MMTRPIYRNRSLTLTAFVAACALVTVNGCSSSKSQENGDETAPALDSGAPAGTDSLPSLADGATPPVASTDPASQETVAKTETPPPANPPAAGTTQKPALHKKLKTKHAARTRNAHPKAPEITPPAEQPVQETNISQPAPVAEPAPVPAPVVAQQPPAPVTQPPAAAPAAVVMKTDENNTPARAPASPRNSEAKADEISAESPGGFADIFATYRNAILGTAVVVAGGIGALSMKKKKPTQV